MEEAGPEILDDMDSLDHREVSRTVTADLRQDQGQEEKRWQGETNHPPGVCPQHGPRSLTCDGWESGLSPHSLG